MPKSETQTNQLIDYRWSCLGRGLMCMWQSSKVALVVVVVNAVVQALLIAPTVGTSVGLLYEAFSLLCSAVVLLVSALVLQSAVVESLIGDSTWRSSLRRSRSCALRYVICSVAVALLVVLGLLYYTWPGLLIAALLPYVMLSAVCGAANPFKANFSFIAARPQRWVITMFAIGVIALVAWILMALVWFFIPTAVGAFLLGIGGGLLCWWWSTSLALVVLNVEQERNGLRQ